MRPPDRRRRPSCAIAPAVPGAGVEPLEGVMAEDVTPARSMFERCRRGAMALGDHRDLGRRRVGRWMPRGGGAR